MGLVFEKGLKMRRKKYLFNFWLINKNNRKLF